MEKITPLVRGICPICNVRIMNDNCSKYNDKGTEVLFYFTDGTKANFEICLECKSKLTKEQAEKIITAQKVNWGIEIQKQLSWYIAEAIHLKVDRFE
jgi:adenylate cyclase class IV